MAARSIPTLVLAALTAGSAVARDETPGDVKRHLLASWDSAERAVRTARVKDATESYRMRDGQPLRLHSTQTTRYVIAPDRYLSETFRTEPGAARAGEVELVLSNDRYSATLRAPRPGGAWTLAGYKPELPPAAVRRGIVLPWTVLPNVQLTDWLADPLVALTRAERPGGPVVRLHFTVKEGGKPVDPTIRSGWIDFDPARSYCVTGYRISRRTRYSESVETCTCEYAPGGEIPVLTRAVLDSPDIRSEKFGTFGTRAVRAFEIEYNGDVADDPFWLSHYGLPEPVGVDRPVPTPRYVWFLAAAGGFAALMLGFRYLARRRAAKRPAPA